MLKIIRHLLGNRGSDASSQPQINSDIQPTRPFFAVGDIHGSYEELQKLMLRIDSVQSDCEQVVFLGDMIDRGPKSAQVLDYIFDLCQSHPDKYVALMGNHEKMLLEFIDDPAGRGARWLTNGGLETLESYGIPAKPYDLDVADATKIADALESALQKDLSRWLHDLPRQWSSGNIHCVHAGMNPDRSPSNQSERSLIWGHPDFLLHPRKDGQFVVHGHTIVPSPRLSEGRISIDTGAYKNCTLTAAHITHGQVEFLQT